MRIAASVYTFLLFYFRLNFSNMVNFQHASKNCTNCRNVQREIELMKQTEIIKLEIMRRLNISTQKDGTNLPKNTQTTPKTDPDVVTTDYEYRGADILSYSEPADNFTDENIVQFRLGDRTSKGHRFHVSSANLLVRVKYKRRKKRRNTSIRSTRNLLDGNKRRTKKNNKPKSKAVDLKLFTVNRKGKPDQIITSVTSRLKKTKWLKLSLPRNVVQDALDASNNTLQVYITCRGCGKRANIILVHKRRKRKRNKQTKKIRRLHKRRPRLLTRVTRVGVKAKENQ